MIFKTILFLIFLIPLNINAEIIPLYFAQTRALPVISPDQNTIAFEEAKEEDFTEEISTINYNEQDIEQEEWQDEGEGVFISTTIPEEPAPINLGGDGQIKITRKDTGEVISVKYRNEDGTYNQDALNDIKGIMRCSFSGKEIKTPIKLIELLDSIEDKFKKRGIILLSGYRSRTLNAITSGAARESFHTLGWAADIRINGFSSKSIKNYAKKLSVGGVGYYPNMNFVHVDIGKIRYWQQIPRKSKKRKTHHKKISKK